MSKTQKKIAVVEDDEILLKALNIELLSDAYEVVSAKDGEIGLELIRKEKPDLILLDILLPKMNGFEVLEKIKKDEKTKNIPVIILSNLGQDADIEKGMKLGAKDYHVKASTDLSELSEKIEKYLR